MQTPSEPHPALTLFDAGISDLIPIAPPCARLAPSSRLNSTQLGKVPSRLLGDGTWVGFPRWQEFVAKREDVERWIADGAGIGLRTRHFPAIDCDVADPGFAAELRDLLPRLIGGGLSPVRVGNAPKFAVACRTDAPFPKQKLTLTFAGGTSAGAIEFLGDRNQYVVAGTHAKTGNPYVWHLGEQVGGLEILAAFPHEQLPVLTAQIIDERIAPALEQWASARGLRINASKASADVRADVDQLALRAPSLEVLSDVVEHIPNDASDWDLFIKVAIAIHAAADVEVDGLEIFRRWSERWTAGASDADGDRAVWEGLKRPHSIGYDFLVSLAREAGYNDAPLTFEVLSLAPEAPTAVVVFDTEAERLAALLKIPSRAFLSGLSTLADGDLKARWNAVRAAARADDPLGNVFWSSVIPVASHARVTADDRLRYGVVLDAQLGAEKGSSWKNLPAPNRQLLLKAAHALFANLGSLVETASDSPGDPLPLTAAPRDDLVAGFIPSRSVIALVGQPGQGKSFVALELAGRVAKVPATDAMGFDEQEQFMHAEVAHGSVLYFASEGVSGWKARAAAWSQVHGDLTHLHLFANVPPLTDLGRALPFILDAIARVDRPNAPPIKLIVIDVFRAAVHGEENSSDVISSAMTTATVIGRMANAAVLLVHHAGHAEKERARGSSAFPAAMDFIGALTKKDSVITLRVTKNKDGQDGQEFSWKLKDDVLRECRPVVGDDPTEGMEAWGRFAAAAIRGIAVSGINVTRGQLSDEMVTRYPSVFSSQHLKASTARSRLSRGIARSVERGWITPLRDRFTIGATEPPTASVEELLEWAS